MRPGPIWGIATPIRPRRLRAALIQPAVAVAVGGEGCIRSSPDIPGTYLPSQPLSD